jgi:hypothetical protein
MLTRSIALLLTSLVLSMAAFSTAVAGGTAQSSSSSPPEVSITTPVADGNQTLNLDAARQQYLLAWNNTAFGSQFDVFVEEGSVLGDGAYREHVPANVFRPEESIVLYVEPVGFGHKPITNASKAGGIGYNSTTHTTLYLTNMTADITVSDPSGTELQSIKDVPVGNLISHIQNTELFVILTVRQSQPFPVGDYIITYVIHDQVSEQSFQIKKTITIADNATTTTTVGSPLV